MKIGLIGASGFIGAAVLNEALSRHHHVMAILRSPKKFHVTSDYLTVVNCDIMETEKLAALLKGNDIILSAYNPGWTNPNIYSEYLIGSQSIQQAVKQSGIKRYFVVGGAGSLFIAPGRQLVDTPEFPEAWRGGALAARDYLKILQNENQLEWTFLCPAIEMNQGTPHQRTGKYRIGLDNPVFDKNNRSIISVEDLAVAVLDEVENPRHIRQRFTVAY